MSGAAALAGPAGDLCRHAAALRRLAMRVAAVLTGVRSVDAGSSPLRTRLDDRMHVWQAALDADAEALGAHAALLDRLAAGWPPPVRAPWPVAVCAGSSSPRVPPGSGVPAGSLVPAESLVPAGSPVAGRRTRRRGGSLRSGPAGRSRRAPAHGRGSSGGARP
ncbi:hypothetical protein [Candidatus Frankia alpina]|uniref:hypothetical protein n=1 Tax=Candidatus Frankia alpina TaxID=2699483 RepID=UPI0013D4D437|nr:hypothetical protein [Candidatus Frankia alpina]